MATVCFVAVAELGCTQRDPMAEEKRNCSVAFGKVPMDYEACMKGVFDRYNAAMTEVASQEVSCSKQYAQDRHAADECRAAAVTPDEIKKIVAAQDAAAAAALEEKANEALRQQSERRKPSS